MKNLKNLTPFLFILALIGFILFAVFYSSANTTIEIYTKNQDGQTALLKGEQVTVAFTKPFSSLSENVSAEVISTYKTDTGMLDLTIPPGRYGLMIEYRGNLQLYDQLELDPTIPENEIDDRGIWQVEVKDEDNYFRFDVDQTTE